MAEKRSSQAILRTVWKTFKEVLKYLLLYLVFYAVLKLIIIEILAYENEGLVAGIALILTLAAYYIIRRRRK